MTGDTAAQKPVEDSLFNISEPAIRLRRNIQVYEWKEKKESKSRDKVGGGKETTTTYTYEKTWSAELTRSSHFKSPEDHRNPEKLEVAKQEFVAKDATLGQFKLTPEIIGKIPGDETLTVTEEQLVRARVLAISLSAALAWNAHAEGLAEVEREALAGLDRTLRS